MFEYNKAVEYLKENSEEGYRSFHKNLLPGIDNILGVRLPAVRKLAKDILKGEYGDYNEFLDTVKYDYYEETMLEGLVIAGIKCKPQEHFAYIKKFVPKINNWAVCDSFCGSLKNADKYPKEFYDFILQYINAKGEYERRFMLIMLLSHFVDEEHIYDIFQICDRVDKKEYYVQMGVAWLISLCFVKFEDKTWEYLKKNQLDKFTYNKSLQKITESNRVDSRTKGIIKSMKKQA